MNTERLCVEFEKVFGQYKSKRIKACQRIPSGGKTMMSQLYSSFFFEVSLYLKIRVSELKRLFGNDWEYLYSLSDKVHYLIKFIIVLEEGLEKTLERSDQLPIYLAKIYTSVSRDTDMLDQMLQKLFIECRMSLEFLFYETVVLTFEFSIRRKNEKGQCEIICIKTKDLL